jgi:hypothetical protein
MQNNFILSPITISEFTSLIESAVRNAIAGIDPNQEKLLTSEEVQSLLKISHTTLQKWRDNRQIPFTRKGGKIFYRKQEILEVFKTNQLPTNK